MEKRIKLVSEEPPKADNPQSMDDLLGQAHNDWKFQRKDACILKLIAAIGMMSTGVAGAMKTANQALQLAYEAHEKIVPGPVASDDQNIKEMRDGQ